MAPEKRDTNTDTTATRSNRENVLGVPKTAFVRYMAHKGYSRQQIRQTFSKLVGHPINENMLNAQHYRGQKNLAPIPDFLENGSEVKRIRGICGDPRQTTTLVSPTQANAKFGAPLNFRGLQHAPVNKQGVVYLLGMVSRDLNFLIESVRTSFPDCEGKRCVDKKKEMWERVLIAFEYRSSGFRNHKHDEKK